MENLFTKLTLNIPGVMTIGPDKLLIDTSHLTCILALIVTTDLSESKLGEGRVILDWDRRSAIISNYDNDRNDTTPGSWLFKLRDEDDKVIETYRASSSQLIDAIWDNFTKFSLPRPTGYFEGESIDKNTRVFIMNSETGTGFILRNGAYIYMGTAKPVNGKMGEPGVKYDFMRSPYFC